MSFSPQLRSCSQDQQLSTNFRKIIFYDEYKVLEKFSHEFCMCYGRRLGPGISSIHGHGHVTAEAWHDDSWYDDYCSLVTDINHVQHAPDMYLAAIQGHEIENK